MREKRYYIAGGEDKKALDQRTRKHMDVLKHGTDLAKEFGFEDAIVHQGRVAGFEVDPDMELPEGFRIAKSGAMDGYAVPARRTAAGRALLERLELKHFPLQHEVLWEIFGFGLYGLGAEKIGDDWVLIATANLKEATPKHSKEITQSQYYMMKADEAARREAEAS